MNRKSGNKCNTNNRKQHTTRKTTTSSKQNQEQHKQQPRKKMKAKRCRSRKWEGVVNFGVFEAFCFWIQAKICNNWSYTKFGVILAYTCVKPLVRLYVCQRVGLFWVHFGVHFGSILYPFWVHFVYILCPFWVHFWSMLGPFWVHFGDASLGFRVSISI